MPAEPATAPPNAEPSDGAVDLRREFAATGLGATLDQLDRDLVGLAPGTGGSLRPWRVRRDGAVLAASHIAVAAPSAGLLSGVVAQSRAREQAIREIVNAHARAALNSPMVQGASSDTHVLNGACQMRRLASPRKCGIIAGL